MESPSPMPTSAYERWKPAKAATTAATLAMLTLALGGCASAGKALDKTLQAVGVKKESADPAPSKPVEVPLSVMAGSNLNAGTGKTALTLVVRIYQLRNRQRFEQAPFDAFLNEQSEQAALGPDLIRVSEVLVSPGQRYDVMERVAGEAAFVGAVALFRTPAGSRWRFLFDAPEAATSGITLGLHACAMTTTSPGLVTVLSSEPHSLTSVNCATGR